MNPFPTTTYAGPEYFCDRVDELNSLINKDMIYFETDSKGIKTCKVYDLLLRRWLQYNFK